MRRIIVILILIIGVIASVAFTRSQTDAYTANLRQLYSKHPSKWPRPTIDHGIEWQELGILPDSPIKPHLDSLKHVIELGKVLFFDTRMSGSGKIACASCHKPELSWTDGLEVSQGHDGTLNKRNSPSLQNVWFYKKLFWDGRSRDLEDQAFAPINSESEMHSDMRSLPFQLKKIKGYAALFTAAYGDPSIDPDRIATALAMFQRTIVSQKSRFDKFVAGKKNALTDSELWGLHLFRTKARCMNCHNGPMFSDNQFHNAGFHRYGDPKMDPGLYNITHNEQDIGKFRTPSLRDVLKTGPWMHQGIMTHMMDIIMMYNKGFGNADRLLKQLFLTPKEQGELLDFLKAISSDPIPFVKPALPE